MWYQFLVNVNPLWEKFIIYVQFYGRIFNPERKVPRYQIGREKKSRYITCSFQLMCQVASAPPPLLLSYRRALLIPLHKYCEMSCINNRKIYYQYLSISHSLGRPLSQVAIVFSCHSWAVNGDFFVLNSANLNYLAFDRCLL